MAVVSNDEVTKHTLSLKVTLEQFKSYWNIISAKRRAILIAAVIGALLGLLFSIINKPSYFASTTFVLDNSKKGGLGEYASAASKLGLFTTSSGGLFQDEDNIVTFLKSRTMVAQTLYSRIAGSNERLIDRYIKFNNYSKKWQGSNLAAIEWHDSTSLKTILEDSITTFFYKDILEDNLEVFKPDKEKDIIVVNTNSTDEIFSKSFNENLIVNATNFYVSLQTRRSQENVDILAFQTDSVKKLMNQALVGVAINTDANPNPNPAFQTTRVPSQKKLVDVEINKAILQELVKNLELARISLRRETPLIQVIDSPVLPLEKRKIGKLIGIILGFFLVSFFYICYLIAKTYIKKNLEST